jgi:multidrug resistance efflux pump
MGPDNWKYHAEDIYRIGGYVSDRDLALILAKEAQSIIELKAPIAGTVMSVDASVGEELGTSAIITIADLKVPTLDVYLDETDLDKAVVGYDADVVFDALPHTVYLFVGVASLALYLVFIKYIQGRKTVA